MSDRLVSLLQWFELRARVFQSGTLRRPETFDGADGLGYIHVLRGGGLSIQARGRPPLRVVEPSLVFCLQPIAHRLDPDKDGAELLCGSFEFGAGLHNPLLKALPGIVALPLAGLPVMNLTLEALFTEASGERCGRQAILDRLMETLIVQLLREMMSQGRVKAGLLAGLADPRLARAINAMHAEPGRSWSLASLAAEAGMSRARFAAGFRDTVGTTPMVYLAEWRLSIAQALLRKGQAVQQVADEVGYGSASALSRAFTAQLGLSPTAWRAGAASA